MKNVFLQVLKKSKDKRYIKTFYSTIFWGILSYLYVFVNNLFNCDNLACEPMGYGTGLTSGRWGLDLFGQTLHYFWGSYNVPFFNGIISVLLLALTSCVIIEIFDIKNQNFCMLIGGLTAVFPAIADCMIYSFTVMYYISAVLLSALGVYILTRTSIVKSITGVILITLSLGVYQAYFQFSLSLLLLFLVKMCVNNKFKPKDVILKAFKFLVAVILAYALYIVILNVSLKIAGLSLSDYQSISSMGKVDLKILPERILKSYKMILKLPLRDYISISATRIIKASLIFFYAVSAFAICFFTLKKWKEKKLKILLMFLFLAVLPISINLIYITSPEAYIYTLMGMAFISLFYLPVILLENINVFEDLENIKFSNILKWVTTFVLFITILNYSWQANGNFRSVYFLNQRYLNYTSNLYSRIRSTKGFNISKKILFVGRFIEDPTFTLKYNETPFAYGGTHGIHINTYARYAAIKNYLGYDFNEIFKNSKEYKKYENYILTMRKYPNDGSIKVLENVVLVRFE